MGRRQFRECPHAERSWRVKMMPWQARPCSHVNLSQIERLLYPAKVALWRTKSSLGRGAPAWPMTVEVSHHVDASEPDQAALMGWNRVKHGYWLKKRDLRHPLFLGAMAYLRMAGKSKLDWLDRKSGSYVPLNHSDA